MIYSKSILVAMQVALAAEQCDAEGMLIQSGAFDPDADKDLQADLDLEHYHPSSDLEEVAAPAVAAVVATAASAETGAAVPSTPPQESAEPAERPTADMEATSAPVEPPAADISANDAPKVCDTEHRRSFVQWSPCCLLINATSESSNYHIA